MINSSRNTNKYTQTTVDSLPDEIFIRIFELLSAATRICVERVCKRWNVLSQRSWSQYRFINDDFCIYERRITKGKEMFKVLPTSDVQQRSDILKNVLSRGGKYVKSIELGKNVTLRQENVVTTNTLPAVFRFCPNLEAIHFSGTVSKTFLNSLAQHCRRLQLISLTNNRLFLIDSVDRELGNLFRNCVHLRSLELNDLRITGRCFSYLPVEMKSVSCTPCSSLVNEEVRNLADRCPKLEMLDLRHCSEITVDCLTNTLPNFVELRTLNLYFFETTQGPQLSIALSILKCLTQLDLSNNDWVSEETMVTISASLSNLNKLNIAYCGKVTDIGMNHLCKLQCLTNLNVSYCQRVTNESVKSMAKLGRLEVLEFEDYDEINDKAIVELAERCSNLTKLVLSGELNITDRSVKALAKLHQLDVLKLDGCKNVTDDAVKTLTKHRPPLTILDLSQSSITDNGVKMLVKLDRLEVLSISHNENITDDSVKVLAKCTYLRKLQL